MLQQWLNVAGLSFDFIGVLMLAYEWWIALNTERKEIQLAEQEMRFRPHPMTPQPHGEHQAVFERMREDQRFRQRVERAHTAHNMRREWFVIAFVFIASGFALQFLGSWPGGLPGYGN
jgi:hypothetical protein